MKGHVIQMVKVLDDSSLRKCPVCGGRCIRWRKNDMSFIVACVSCRYHMGPYTRPADALRAHNRTHLKFRKSNANKRVAARR
jgi:Zn ribbon nucleic-acid-binding protein